MSEGTKETKMGKGTVVFLCIGVGVAAVGGAILTVGAIKAAMAKRAAAKKG